MSLPDLKNIKLPDWHEPLYFHPVWEAYNPAAVTLVDDIIETYGLRKTTAALAKNKIIVASILKLIKDLGPNSQKDIGCSANHNAFSGYSSGVGRRAIQSAFNLLDGQLLRKVPESGTWAKPFAEFEDIFGGSYAYADVTRYEVKAPLELYDRLEKASFCQFHTTLVMVNASETEAERRVRRRKPESRRTPKMSLTEARRAFGEDFKRLEEEVRDLNAFYRQHPLELAFQNTPAATYVAAARRVFHSGRLDAGGRFYGAWTSLKERQRLACRIDGEAVVSIDINASQPFLFSMLMGVPMAMEGASWSDLYVEVLESHGIQSAKEMRDKLKRVALEVLGTGNAWKVEPSEEWAHQFEDGEWEALLSAMRSSLPAFELIDREYLNGPNFISYHEAEILRQTLLALMSRDIPAYSVHDCILVRQSDELTAVSVFRDALNAYVKQHCVANSRPRIMDCFPALKLSSLSGEPRRIAGTQSWA